MAAVGHTAIAEIQFADYVFPAFDQVRRQGCIPQDNTYVRCRLLMRLRNTATALEISLTAGVLPSGCLAWLWDMVATITASRLRPILPTHLV